MLRKISKHWNILLAFANVTISWCLFPFLTYNDGWICLLLPLLILVLQGIHLFFYKRRKLLWMLLLNPALFYPLYYTLTPAINYYHGRPTMIQCCSYLPGTSPFDEEKMVFLEYFDDDCDPEGYYHYTLEINNYVTFTLIDLFGNPITRVKRSG